MNTKRKKSQRIIDVLDIKNLDKQVRISGWIRTNRNSKTLSFLQVNDGSCINGIQVVANNTLINYESQIRKLTTGSSVSVEGILKESPSEGQKYELVATEVIVEGLAPEDYPLQKKRHSFEYLRTIAHLRPRTNTFGAIMRLRNSLSYAIHTFFQQKGFLYLHSPIITSSDCEGAGEMFKVTTFDLNAIPKKADGSIDFSKDFFGKSANLTVSGQLEGEIYALAFSNIYTFGPTFRAENSNTSRHLAEFWMIEPEMAFCDIFGDMDLAEDFVRYLAAYALEKNIEDLEFLNKWIEPSLISTLRNISENSFERITYSEAISLLEKSNDRFCYKVSWGSDIQSEHERHLTEEVFKKPVIIFNYPKGIKAFYMKLNEDGRTVAAMDLVAPRIGELIGGSEREERYDVLVERLSEFGLNQDDYWWYLELRKYGGAPHAGFGLGFERLMLLFSGMQNIRDVIPFPRYPGCADF